MIFYRLYEMQGEQLQNNTDIYKEKNVLAGFKAETAVHQLNDPQHFHSKENGISLHLSAMVHQQSW